MARHLVARELATEATVEHWKMRRPERITQEEMSALVFEQQRYIVRASKSLAMELACPAIVISQLRKSLQGEDRKKPTLQRLYGSGAKAKHSSTVIYVDRPYVQELAGDETEARIVVAKNRDGKVGAIEARFNVRTLRFESAPKPEQARPARPDWQDR